MTTKKLANDVPTACTNANDLSIYNAPKIHATYQHR
jgi:hypothetical protein